MQWHIWNNLSSNNNLKQRKLIYVAFEMVARTYIQQELNGEVK